jgi:hypothetical protein
MAMQHTCEDTPDWFKVTNRFRVFLFIAASPFLGVGVVVRVFVNGQYGHEITDMEVIYLDIAVFDVDALVL